MDRSTHTTNEQGEFSETSKHRSKQYDCHRHTDNQNLDANSNVGTRLRLHTYYRTCSSCERTVVLSYYIQR